MIALIFILLFTPQSGWLSAYVSERSGPTLEYRLEMGDVQWGYDVYIAVADCSRIGNTGTMTYITRGPVLSDSGIMTYIENDLELTFQVFDCSGHDAEPGTAVLTSGGYIAELDYASWQHYGLGKVVIEYD